ncbi:winged helix-turn-helix domain-containing protein [Pseudoalteromonas sp. SMS1]|uniref:winged helix-turn-helix domain-containing protein n=1 Tax=Pseudoalteromonas sp. SMS1 TaxID=2908894 RepID=UPI001F31CA34|nr:winged helix-turn-helix domain-containing protein [Pseudoalteromonas sp. SMS1]MCF2858450.1 winged helix-turn-helix domain-containing protein [Pseudoalteromonas sp. SMS1]
MNIVAFCKNIEKIKLESWTIYPDKQLLTDNDKIERELEPLLFRMLLYFIDNSHRIVTRQELSDEVWQQPYVDDNAINRAISELRKALKSDKQRGQTLKTHYRTGYSFVLDVEIIYKGAHAKSNHTESAANPQQTVENAALSSSPSLPPMSNAKYIWGVLGVIACVTVGVMLKDQLPAPVEEATSVAQSHGYNDYITLLDKEILTWSKGSVAFQDMSSDSALLAYSFLAEGKRTSALYVKDMKSLQNSKLVEVAGANVMPTGWAADGARLYYQISSIGENKVCELWLATFSPGTTDAEHTKVWDCNAERRMSVTSVDSTLLYTKYDYRDRPYISAIFSKDLSSGTEFQVTSPNIRFSGDFYVKLSHSKREILFLRSIKNGTAIFKANADGSEQELLVRLNYRLRSVEWSSDDSKVMWFDDNENKLMTYELASKIVSSMYFPLEKEMHGSMVVSPEQLIFSTKLLDGNIYQIDESTSEALLIPFSESDATESLVAPFNHAKGGIYLARGARNQSLWKIIDGVRTKFLELPTTEIVDIVLSSDDSQLLVAYQNRLEIIAMNDLSVVKSIAVSDTIADASWGLNDNIVMTLVKDTSDAWSYSLTEQKFVRLTKKGIHSARMIDDSYLYYFDKNYKLFKRELETGNEQELLDLSDTTHLSWSMTNDFVYFSSGNSVSKMDLSSLTVTRLLTVERKTDSFFGIFTGAQKGQVYVYAKRLQNNHLLNVSVAK